MSFPKCIPPKRSAATAPAPRLAVFAILAALAALVPAPVLAQGLPFSFNCQVHQAVPVQPPNNALLLTKQPVPHPNGTASVHDLLNLENYVIPAGVNSCVVANPPANGDFCFIARSDATILSVGIAAIRNPGGLPACQQQAAAEQQKSKTPAPAAPPARTLPGSQSPAPAER